MEQYQKVLFSIPGKVFAAFFCSINTYRIFDNINYQKSIFKRRYHVCQTKLNKSVTTSQKLSKPRDELHQV